MEREGQDTSPYRALDSFDSSSPPQFLSSPLASSLIGSKKSGKLKKPPTVTPKRFTRFFAPRSSSSRSRIPYKSSSGRQLRDITCTAINSSGTQSRNSVTSITFEDIQPNEGNAKLATYPSTKKRKDVFNIESSHTKCFPCKKVKSYKSFQELSSDTTAIFSDISETEQPIKLCENVVIVPSYIRRKPLSGLNGSLLRRTFGAYDTDSRSSRSKYYEAWRYETENFHSTAKDYHVLPKTALPFCASSCNTNSLVAIGDEGGSIRLLETAAEKGHQILPAHLTFRPHTNAVMDMAFSSDDALLATASGDQTTHVIDMLTQRTKYVMVGHASSVKQVRFLPGNSNVLATSSRDGSVRLWDIRCKGSKGSIQEVQDGNCPSQVKEGSRLEKSVSYVSTYDTISGAHSVRTSTLFEPRSADLRDTICRSETMSSNRHGGVSVTALTFLPNDRSHILLTASEASTCIKVWDIRSRHSNRRGGAAVPLSVTKQPESHTRHRQFGVNSLALSGDSARVYALSRDSTVYAYSTRHLILGAGPEFSSDSNPRRHPNFSGSLNEGAGPLYGYRHPRFQAATFYVKLALRPATTTNPEMLAVGSSDSCAVVFPTDEAYHDPNSRNKPIQDTIYSYVVNRRPRTRARITTTSKRSSSLSSSSFPSPRLMDTIPMHSHGSALVGGHRREVTSVCWTINGELVTVSDDLSARCWRDNEERARYFRNSGEHGRKLSQTGWVELDPSATDDDDDDDDDDNDNQSN